VTKAYPNLRGTRLRDGRIRCICCYPCKASANSTERFGKETDTEENGNSPSGVLSDFEDDDSEEDLNFDTELDALLIESPTLECVGEEDVALDMDGWELDLGSDTEEEMSEESEGEEIFE